MMTRDELFRFMMEREAFEVHIVPGSPMMYRDKKGVLLTVDANTLTPADTKKIVAEVLNEEQITEFSENKQIQLAYSVPGLSRYRMNVFMQRNSIALVVNTVPPKPPTIEELGLPELITNLADKATKGLVLIIGPKGAGKAHTLAAMINYILETRTCKIVTLENPIRFLFKNKKGIICQREVGIDAKDFNTGFAQLPQLGADIFVVNEIDNFDTAHKLLTMAAGGQLIFVTSVVASVQLLIERIVSLYPETLKAQCRTLLSVGLEAIISQVLVNKATEEGMVPAMEIMIAAGPIKGMLKDGKTYQIQTAMATMGRELGMVTQEQSLRQYIKKNIITQDEAYAKCIRPEELRKVMALPF